MGVSRKLFVRRIPYSELHKHDPKKADSLMDECLHMPGRGIGMVYIFVACRKDGSVDLTQANVQNLHTLIERDNVIIVNK